MTVLHIQSKTGDMVWDDSCAPIYFTNNRGTWTVEQLRKWYENRTETFLKEIAKGHKVFHIGDFSEAAMPDALLRKALADLQAEFDVEFMDKGTWLGQCYVVRNPLMRGLITAVQWMTGGLAAPATTAADLRGAVRVAEQAYRAHGLEMPQTVPRDHIFQPFEGEVPREDLGPTEIRVFTR